MKPRSGFKLKAAGDLLDMGFIRPHNNDILLIFALLILALGTWGLMLSSRKDGGEAVVTVDGAETARLPLSRDAVIIAGGGEHTNTVVVENGEVYVSEASCPDHVCIRQGPARYDGQTIVCLPNRLVITVSGTGGGPDAVVQ